MCLRRPQATVANGVGTSRNEIVATAPTTWRALVLLIGGAVGLASVPAQAPAGSWQLAADRMIEFDRQLQDFSVRAGRPAADFGERVVISAAQGGARWRSWQGDGEPPAGWTQPEFDDRQWSASNGGFGGVLGGPARSEWTAARICLRTTFDWTDARPAAAVLTVRHDDDVTVYLNGTQVFAEEGARGYQHVVLPRAALDAVRAQNVLAVHCTDRGGDRFADAGLLLLRHEMDDHATYAALATAADDAGRGVQRALFTGTRAPAVLFGAELDAKQRRWARPPADLRDVAAHFALSLHRAGRAHSIAEVLPRLPRIGDLRVVGSAEALDRHGEQLLRLELESTAPDAARQDRRSFARNVLPHCDHSVRGHAVIRRGFDADSGRVSWFRVRLQCAIEAPADTTVSLSMVETWQAKAERAIRDADFRVAVGDALRRGADYLLSQIDELDAKPIGDAVVEQRSYASGRLALALLALVRTGHHENPAVQRGFAALRRRQLVDTYSLASAIMAIEAYYAPPTERDDLLSGLLAGPRERQPSAEDRAAIERWVAALLQNVDTRADADRELRFNYVRGARSDLSVHQYGLLGLYSAHLCGVRTPEAKWRAAARYVLDRQAESAAKIKLSLQSAGGGKPARARAVGIAGWAYREWKGVDGLVAPVYGATTSASLTSLALCKSVLGARGLGARTYREVQKALDAGFAWVAANFSVRTNPGWVARTFVHQYYYLYALERACELNRVAGIQGRDWYREGAAMLLEWQQADGSFAPDLHGGEPLERAAMAVLFLAKSAPPVLTQS